MQPEPVRRGEIRDFLVSRRARITPEQVGLPASTRRRVPGLRREEVAVLAGVSTEWYTRLEKGHIGGVSSEVLAAVSGALRLNDDERRYLFDLASAARGQGRPRADRRDIAVPAAMQWALDSITLSSAFIRTGRTDIVASNAVARALFAPMLRSETVDRAGRPNIARYAFLDPGARRFFVDWEAACSSTAALLRAEIARQPGDRPIRDLVRELSAGSEVFRSHWKAHDVLMRHDGLKHLDHPHVGNLELAFQSLDLHLPEDGARQLVLYTAEPGTLSEDRLKLLAIIAASELGPGRPGAGTPGDAQISIASDEIG